MRLEWVDISTRKDRQGRLYASVQGVDFSGNPVRLEYRTDQNRCGLWVKDGQEWVMAVSPMRLHSMTPTKLKRWLRIWLAPFDRDRGPHLSR